MYNSMYHVMNAIHHIVYYIVYSEYYNITSLNYLNRILSRSL